MKIKRGSTSVRRLIFVADSSSTVGAGLTGLAHNSSGLVAYYFAGDLNNDVQITLASATLGSWTSGGFVEVDATNMPGWYEVGIPDAALDGGNEVAIQYRGATNMVPVNIYVELDAVDYQSATTFGLSKFGDIETDTQDIQSRLPAALVSGRIDASVGAMAADTLTASALASDAVTEISDAVFTVTQAALSPNAPVPVVRSVNDTRAITFSWPVSGATITGQKSVNNGSYSAVSGAIAFLRTENSRHYYTLAYNSADRVATESVVRYKLTDGTYTKYFNLQLTNTADQVLEESVDDHDNVPHSLAKYISIIKKANTLVEGTVQASPTPTSTVFKCNVDYPTGAFEHAVLVFQEDATLAEQNSPILTWVNNGDGTSTVTLEEARTAAPVAGDKFFILPASHVHSVSDIKSQIFAGGDIDGYSLEQALKIFLAALAGKVSGGGTTSIIFRAADDSKNRITATVTAAGNRTAIILDGDG